MNNIIGVRPSLNSQRPTVNREILTDSQKQQRNSDIAEQASNAGAMKAVGKTALNLGVNEYKSGDSKPLKSIAEGLAAGAVSSVLKGTYEHGKDALHTHVTGNVSENKGAYAPDLSNQRVQNSIKETARREIANGQGTRMPDGTISTPTLKKLGLTCTDDD